MMRPHIPPKPSPKKGVRRRRRRVLIEATQATPELDKAQLQAELDLAHAKVKRLMDDNSELVKQQKVLEESLEGQKKEQNDIYLHFLREIDVRDKEILQAKEEIKELDANYKRHVDTATQQYDGLKATKEEELTLVKEENEDLSRQLKELEDFKLRKHQMEADLEGGKETIVAMTKQHKAAVEDQKKAHEVEEKRLKGDLKKKMKKTNDELVKLVDDHLNIRTQKIIKENEKLTREIELYDKEVKQATQANQTLQASNVSLRRDLDLQTSNTNELIRKSQSQQLTIKTLVNKLQSLEAVVDETKTAADDEKSRKITALSETVDKQYELILDLKREVDDAKDKYKDTDRQLRAAKQQTAAHVSRQEEAQAFLLQCLDDVRAAIDIAAQNQGETPRKSATSRLLNLEPTDREGVLQFLMHKLALFETPQAHMGMWAPRKPAPPPPRLNETFPPLRGAPRSPRVSVL